MFCVRHLRLVPAVPVLFIMCAVFVGTDVHFVCVLKLFQDPVQS